MTEAAKMTEKSKTVTLERRAGDLTALYCMQDWMIALVLAVIAVLTVWAGLIIYEYIQTVRGKRRKGNVVDTIREREKDEMNNTNDDNGCAASTEDSEMVSGTLNSWEEDGWMREPMKWMPKQPIENKQSIEEIPTTSEDQKPIEEIPTTNEDEEPIKEIPTTTEDQKPIEEIPTTNEDEEPIKEISTTSEEKAIEEIPTTNEDEDEEPIEEISVTSKNVEPILTNPTITNDNVGGTEKPLTISHVDLLSGTQTRLLECPGDDSTVCSNENLTDILTDTDLQEPGDLCDMKTKETKNQPAHFCDVATDRLKHPDIKMASHVAVETFSDTDLTKALPKHRRVGEMAPTLQASDNVCDAVMAKGPCPVPRLELTTPVVLANESQEERRDYPWLGTEHGPGMKVENVECPEAGHGKVISERASLEDDMVIVVDLYSKCGSRGCAVQGLMEARDGNVVSKDVEGDDEESLDSLTEESYEKVEINIMEATMDCNEWMAVGGTDTEEPPSSVECLGEMKPHQPMDPPHDLADSSKDVREARTTLEVPGGGLHGENMTAKLPVHIETATLRFCIHYHTHSPRQELAVTGNQPELGSWEAFVPLEGGQDGFWVSSVLLPVERQVEWKFVLVEDGSIQRWEECGNRRLETGSGVEEVILNKWWGCL